MLNSFQHPFFRSRGVSVAGWTLNQVQGDGEARA
jgi:hypothetical protein